MKDQSGSDIKLLIDDFGANVELSFIIRNYHGLAVDYFSNRMGVTDYIHSQIGVRTVMNDDLKTSRKDNGFTPIFDDAKRTLKSKGRYKFIERIPPIDEKDKPKMPFPYGVPPGRKKSQEWIPGISDFSRRGGKRKSGYGPRRHIFKG